MFSVSLNAETHFLQRIWDEECVVYVIDSGETYLLSSACSYLLEHLESGPVLVQTLLYEFLSSSDDLPQAEVSSLLGDIIQELRKIGLISTVEKLS